jgi:vacuolar-type H+-ATPase subunit I/STV1
MGRGSPVVRRTSGWTAGRVLVGLLIPAPLLVLTWVAVAVNNTYFRDEFDPAAFWLESMIFNGPVMLFAGFIMFFRFRRATADRMATLVGGAIFFLMLATIAWWA